MKVEQEAGLAIERSHQFKESTFKIKASAAAFNILSSGLYQDKIAAVIRELSTNAYDAHVQAEQGVKNPDGSWLVKPIPNRSKLPFDVTLPTSMSPIFKIRDYGVGLSEEQVFDLYTTYFSSSKDHSDDFVGEKGLGSKSPFSLVSSFLVISYFNGTRIVYSANIGEEGFPSIIKMDEQHTDQPNGLEINITVSNRDYSNFADRAGKIFYYFQIKPNFLGASKPTIPIINYEFDQRTWAIRVHQYGNYGVPTGVVEGSVCYPINLNALTGKLPSDLFDLLHNLIDSLELRFPIGYTRSAASREGLEYTTKTIQSIHNALMEIQGVLQHMIVKKVEDAPTFLKALQQVNTFQNGNTYFRNITRNFVALGKLKWKGEAITADQTQRLVFNYRVDNEAELFDDPLTKKIYYRFRGENRANTPFKDYGRDLGRAQLEKEEPLAYTADKKVVTKKRFHWSMRFPTQDKYVFILNDNKMPYVKIRAHIKKKTDWTCHYLIFKKEDENVLRNILALFRIEGDEFELTSSWTDEVEVEKFVKQIRIYHLQNSSYTYNRNGEVNSFSSTSCFSTIKMSELAAMKHSIKYYVTSVGSTNNFGNVFEKYDPTKDNKKINTLDINNIFSALSMLDIMQIKDKDKVLFVVPKTDEKRFNQIFPHIQPLYTYMKELKKIILTDAQKKSISLASRYKNVTKDLDENKNLVISIPLFLGWIEKKTQSKDFAVWATKIKNNYVLALAETQKATTIAQDVRIAAISSYLPTVATGTVSLDKCFETKFATEELIDKYFRSIYLVLFDLRDMYYYDDKDSGAKKKAAALLHYANLEYETMRKEQDNG